MSKRIILGLDVSTTTIGVSLMICDGDKNKILKLTHCSPKVSKDIKDVESLFLKKRIFEEDFLKQYVDIGITDVVIEEPLLRSNNVNTVGTLLKFNGMVSDSVYNLFNIVPKYISSYDSRKYAFPELMSVRRFNKKGELIAEKKREKNSPVLFGDYPFDIDKKTVIIGKVMELYPDIEWVYNKKGEMKKECFDSSDAVCCVLGYINKEKAAK